MKKDKFKTKVVFRKFPNGNIIALFPELIYNEDLYGDTMIDSYMHIGQHGGASAEHLTGLEPATPAEYADLKRELEGIGYNLKVSD